MLRKSTGCSSKVEIFKSLLSSSGRVKLLQVYTIQPCASGILKACASLKINKYKFAAQTITKTDQMTYLLKYDEIGGHFLYIRIFEDGVVQLFLILNA